MKNWKTKMNAKSTVSTLALLAVVFAMVFFSGCSKDDGEDDEISVVGRYQIQSAVLLADTQHPVTGVGTILPTGADVAQIFNTLVASAGPCGEDPSNTAIELTNDGKMVYACLNNSSLNAASGFWLLSNDGKTLSITIDSENFGTEVTLNVSNLELTNTSFSGTISNFPFFPADIEATPPVQTVSMDVVFTRL